MSVSLRLFSGNRRSKLWRETLAEYSSSDDVYGNARLVLASLETRLAPDNKIEEALKDKAAVMVTLVRP